MFNNLVEESQTVLNVSLNAGNPADFKKIYDECMAMLFKISYRIVKKLQKTWLMTL